ncbi:LacI family DNA-binding transcriptional regulator [Granulicella sibirica]|uniref:Ribose operon repressor n=1 Tax=Granulicella sibirica TaxID=2479048 RepID=A0A4Q0STA5_9BACT|nr:LacI family DNA-binding transcriptional regulator [Granulicella sibirica]RXH54155.1 Ribose operon repressor [Granulicella sibirica]
MTVTMKDIAQQVGVSIITVSKALRGHSDIGAETSRRVMDKARELNYRPNLAARSLVTGRSSLVGLVVPDLLHPFFVEIGNALARTLKENGYYLIISSSEEDPTLEEHAIEHLLAHRLDALVVSSCSPTLPQQFKRIQEQGTPLVLLDRSFSRFRSNFVGSDDVDMGFIATEHLFDIKRKRIAHIRGPELSTGRSRLEGFLKAYKTRGIEPNPRYIVGTSTVDINSTQQGFAAMTKLLGLPSRPDAVFCYSDPIAIGAMDAILQRGLRIPQDVAVVGCGNLHYDVHLKIPLTSVDQRTSLLGERTGKMLLSILQKPGKSNFRKTLEKARVVVRGSSVATV